MSKTHVAVWLRISPFYDMLLHISNCSEPRHKQHYRGTDCRTEIGINPFDSNQQYGYYFCPCNPFTKEYKCQKNGKHDTGFINGYNLIDIIFLKDMKIKNL